LAAFLILVLFPEIAEMRRDSIAIPIPIAEL